MTEAVRFAGFDPGNSGLKVALWEGGRINYCFIPNLTGPDIEMVAYPKGDQLSTLGVEVLSAEDERYRERMLVGELALAQLQKDAYQDRSRAKALGDGVNVIVPAVLAALDDGRPWVIGVGATLKDVKSQAELIVQRLKRSHTVKFIYGPGARLDPVRTMVLDVSVYPQAAAGIYGMVRNDDDSICSEYADLLDKNILGLDCGHGQWNGIVLQQMVPQTPSKFCLDEGYVRVVMAVREYLDRNFFIPATIPQLQKAVQDECFLINNKRIDLVAVVDRAITEIVEKAYREARETIEPMVFAGLNEIWLLGGAASKLAPFVEARFDLPVNGVPAPLLANARGLMFFAKSEWEGRHHG